MQLYEKMLDNGHEPNTFTCMAILEACNFKGRGLFDVAMLLYAKLATTMPGPVPDVIKTQLLQVCALPPLRAVHADSFQSIDSGTSGHRRARLHDREDGRGGVQVVVTAIRRAPDIREAIKCFVGLQHLRLEDDVSVFNALLRTVARGRDWEKALHIFRHLNEIGVHADTETYNALLAACVQGMLPAGVLCHHCHCCDVL